ncbi:MAG: ABC transporter substrate-binding protein [Geminicoccaceae bacterium]
MDGCARGSSGALLAGMLVAVALTLAGPAMALDKVTFGTNWKAQAEHGGFYQAVADGTYAKYGLDVAIRQGGPQVNHSQLLAAGKIDFNMGGNLFGQFNYTQANVPMVTIAAVFQKEPQVLLAHPDSGVQELADLDDKTLFLSNDGRQTYWLWLKQVYGLSDDQVKPYTFNPAPFLADSNSVQQGYVTSEPFAIQQQGGFEPVVLMMADYGYDTYSTTIETSQRLVDENPDLVQRFVNATIEGWYNYLYGDNKKANELIKADNPEITDDQIAFSIAALKKYGIVDSGDATTLGIGAMTDARWESFFTKSVIWGVYPPDLPYKQGYTLKFVNQGHGLDLRKKLTGG